MRILVVEDEADLNLLLCKVLTRAGYTVDGCMDGEEAELHLMGAEYDGILLDVMLPKKDGYTLVQELRAKGADTPVLFLTARDSVADRVRGLDLGGDDYLVKPFDFDELLARIRAVLRRNQPDRRSYVTKILNKLDALGVGIGTYEDLMAFCNGPQHLGRMHIARSLVAHGYVKTVDEAFDIYIGSFGQRLAYVESELDYAPIEDVLSALQKAQGIAILAHLFFYPLDVFPRLQ